mmetsp:Transcript_95535/g.179794  ORF Transcript_95535/g.179794 Transcript_95535/m.179794 type:complete len:93 (-) Transcript_95535:12-290(-)
MSFMWIAWRSGYSDLYNALIADKLWSRAPEFQTVVLRQRLPLQRQRLPHSRGIADTQQASGHHTSQSESCGMSSDCFRPETVTLFKSETRKL